MKKTLFIYILAMISSLAYSQTEKILNPADLKQQTVITEPLSLRKGFLRVGFTFSYGVLDKYYDDSGKKIYFPESTWGSAINTMLWLQYGITDRIMVEAGMPFVNDLTNYHSRLYAPGYDTMRIFNASNRAMGFGDLVVSGTYQIIPSEGHKFSMKSILDVTIPTGRKNPTNVKSSDEYDPATGDGVFVVTPQITARYLSYPYSLTAYVSYNYNFKGNRLIFPTDSLETGFKYGNSLFAGVMVGLHLNEWIALVNELNFHYAGKGEIDGVSQSDLNTTWAVSYMPKLIFQIRRFRLGEVVNIPLKGKMISADPSYVLLVQYVF
jgi:hypothetical protein